MGPQTFSWLRDTGRLTLRYILVGLAFVPAGLLYAELSRFGHSSARYMVLSLALGFATANVFWKWSAVKRSSEVTPAISQAWAKALAGPAVQNWAVDVTIVEGPSDAALLAHLIAQHGRGQQIVTTRENSQKIDNQRMPEVRFPQGARLAHAAFSSISG